MAQRKKWVAYVVGRAHGAWKGPEQTAVQAVPRVTVQLVNRDGRTSVEAVAEISDGHVTARGTHETALSCWDREYGGTRTLSTQAATQCATQSAVQQARRLLAGGLAGHTAVPDTEG